MSVFWFLFWLMNGLDKFLFRTDLNFITWWGNDRFEKFSSYFEKINISTAYIAPTLLCAGVVEIAISVVFIGSIIALLKGSKDVFKLGIACSIICFIGFIIFDIIVGDRLELWEHSNYLGILLISYIAFLLEEQSVNKPLV